jgi:hypothetical protein
MAEYTGVRVVAGQLVRGFQGARARFSEGVRQQEADPGFCALFETLNWAVAIDDLVREIWVPAGTKLDWGWRKVAGGDELNELLNGTRYARNLVHHHWADALRLDEGFRSPIRSPLVNFSWVWRNARELPEPPHAPTPSVVRNRAAYERSLAGLRAEDTLLALEAAFSFVGNLLDPPRPAPPQPPRPCS